MRYVFVWHWCHDNDCNNEESHYMSMPSVGTCYHCELYPLFSLAVCIMTLLLNDCHQVSTSSVLLLCSLWCNKLDVTTVDPSIHVAFDGYLFPKLMVQYLISGVLNHSVSVFGGCWILVCWKDFYWTPNPNTLFFTINTKPHVYKTKVTCKPYKTQVQIKVSDTHK